MNNQFIEYNGDIGQLEWKGSEGVVDKVRTYFKKLDFIIIITMTILIGVGLYCQQQAFMASADRTSLFIRQIVFIALGYIVIIAITLIDYRILCTLSPLFYIAMQGVLAITLLFADNQNNVKRWITIFGIMLQPSELAKIVLILFMAYLCNRLREKMDKLYTLVILGAAAGIPMVLIILEPHLSSSLALLFIFAIMVYSSGLSYKVIGGALAIVLPVGVALFVAVALFNVQLPFVQGYQINRVLSFLSDDDEKEGQELDYQQLQSIGAIGSGGLHGKLIDSQGDDSREFRTIYAKESDFVFAIVGEEFGFLGSFFIVFLFGVLIIRCLVIASRATDYMGKLLMMGISGYLMFQIFVNIGVATKFLPNTGLPLPFISNGLTSLLSAMIAIGLVLNIGMKQRLRGESGLSFND